MLHFDWRQGKILNIACMAFAGATNHVLTSLVASFDHDPSALLTSLVPLPLRSNLRHYALVFLQGAVKVRPAYA